MIDSQDILPPAPSRGRAYVALFCGVLAMVLSPLFIRWSEAPGLVTAFYKMFITPVILTPVVIYAARKKIVPFVASLRYAVLGKPPAKDLAHSDVDGSRLSDRDRAVSPRKAFPTGTDGAAAFSLSDLKIFLFPLAAGFFSAMDHGLWATSIKMTSVANSTLLNNLSPLWVGLFSLVVWREKLKSRFWLGLAAAFLGTTLVLGSNVFSGGGVSGGDLIAILSSVFYGGFFLVSKKGRRALSVLYYLWAFSAAGAACLFVATRLFGMPLTGYSLRTNLIFLATSLVVQLVAYACITYALGALPASIVAPTMVLQPVLTALIAIPFAGEGLGIAQVVGGVLTLGGIWVVNQAEEKHPAAADSYSSERLALPEVEGEQP
jgi:drug/metabolite transporter (DMT)-like permease